MFIKLDHMVAFKYYYFDLKHSSYRYNTKEITKDVVVKKINLGCYFIVSVSLFENDTY